ncbi:hypothetical protein HLI_00530 [Halobacillus litoralis]|uniref:Uncharacterized protein n=1 Tax=Halobacillus litoralis TaxID=45668 RepID=A0A410M792_9BACI|nr:hypothetical protein HLI_00530 [Halobacillus litoralis]
MVVLFFCTFLKKGAVILEVFPLLLFVVKDEFDQMLVNMALALMLLAGKNEIFRNSPLIGYVCALIFVGM